MIGSLYILGILLASGVLGGWVAKKFKLPTLTGYLGAGVGIAYLSHNLGIDHDQLEQYRLPINDFAMALALFVLGGQFRKDRKAESEIETPKRIFKASVLEALITSLIVGTLCSIALQDVFGGVLLGILAIAVAPATTLEVLHEFKAKGPATRNLKIFTALSNVWAVFLFELALLLIFVFTKENQIGFTGPLWDIIGSVIYGLLAGHLLILFQERFGDGNYVVPLLVVIFLTVGICEQTDVPHMLTFLVTGAVVANRSSFFNHITSAMDGYAQPAFVLFFVLSGSHLQFSELISNGLVVGLYVLGRVIGKIAGVSLGLYGFTQRPKMNSTVNPPIGLGLLCQAGAAIALASYIGEYDQALSNKILAIILGAVVIFELIGPLLVKRVVIAAGEVEVGSLLSRGQKSGDRNEWFYALKRTLKPKQNIGGSHPNQILLEDLMKPYTENLRRSDSMDVILDFANNSPFNHFPVTKQDNTLIGLIALSDLSKISYDRRIAKLITAEDVLSLTTEESSLSKKSSLSDALAFFEKFEGNTVAIVDSLEAPTLCGMLERSEVLRLASQLEGNA